MATFKATRGKDGAPVAGVGEAMDVKVATGTIEITANPVAADIYQMCKVPANAVVFMGWIYGDDLDTGVETLDMDIGWAANGTEALDADGFGNLGLWSGDASVDVKPEVSIMYQFGGVLRTTGPQKFSKETIIQATCNVTAATGGTGTLTVVVLYFIDPNYVVT